MLRSIRDNFYFGIDRQSYFDLQLHLGNIRLECGSSTPSTRGESDQTRGYRPSRSQAA